MRFKESFDLHDPDVVSIHSGIRVFLYSSIAYIQSSALSVIRSYIVHSLTRSYYIQSTYEAPVRKRHLTN